MYYAISALIWTSANIEKRLYTSMDYLSNEWIRVFPKTEHILNEKIIAYLRDLLWNIFD